MRCSRFVAFLLALVTGAISAGISLLLLTEVPRDIKEISVCVRSVKVVVHRSRGRRGRAWPTYDLLIDSGSYPRGFIYGLSMIWPDKAMAKKIRPGDCVVMSVDSDKLSPRYAEPDAVSHLFDWINEKLEPLDLELTLDDYSQRVKILTLENGPNLLISYLDSLVFGLAIFGGLALLFIGLTLNFLWTVIRGATVGYLEPVHFVSPEGYSLSLGNDCLIYREEGYALKLPAWQDLKPERVRLFTGGRGRTWAAPHDHVALVAGEFEGILGRIEAWLSDKGVDYTFDRRSGFDPADR